MSAMQREYVTLALVCTCCILLLVVSGYTHKNSHDGKYKNPRNCKYRKSHNGNSNTIMWQNKGGYNSIEMI